MEQQDKNPDAGAKPAADATAATPAATAGVATPAADPAPRRTRRERAEAVTMADAAPLNAGGKSKRDKSFAEVAKAAAEAEVPFISEAMRQEIETRGEAVDQGTGRRVTREDMEAAFRR